MKHVVEEVEGLYRIIALQPFRKTPGVVFDILPHSAIPDIHSMDRVMHTGGALSPGPVGDVERPWYMHTHQADNLMVLYGERTVDIYSVDHGRVETFVVTPDRIIKNGELIHDGGGMLVWPVNVFHRIRSGVGGSASLNLAVHYEGFSVRTNFNIYDLNTVTGEYRVLREGFMDQMA
ncbi:hypothetical protein OOT00_15025 [Desulfobotulus sp. H1]|uniref:Cupin n=1 Tax=Desulfobotulus pelophilus TaxID=2823377 RepID=A0ABT3NEH2_9BACT|nr:hypothetical protein [Desulfobotulus pelophilus]MCW7755297.1 hypothetical protein [Desulfobotulus pelophilus]